MYQRTGCAGSAVLCGRLVRAVGGRRPRYRAARWKKSASWVARVLTRRQIVNAETARRRLAVLPCTMESLGCTFGWRYLRSAPRPFQITTSARGRRRGDASEAASPEPEAGTSWAEAARATYVPGSGFHTSTSKCESIHSVARAKMSLWTLSSALPSSAAETGLCNIIIRRRAGAAAAGAEAGAGAAAAGASEAVALASTANGSVRCGSAACPCFGASGHIPSAGSACQAQH